MELNRLGWNKIECKIEWNGTAWNKTMEQQGVAWNRETLEWNKTDWNGIKLNGMEQLGVA